MGSLRSTIYDSVADLIQKSLIKTLFFLGILPSALLATPVVYECRNEYFKKPRVFKLDRSIEEPQIFTLYNKSFHLLCDKSELIWLDESVVCIHGTVDHKKRIATMFTFEMKEITDFLVDNDELPNHPSTWRQKTKSRCIEISDFYEF